MRVYKRGNVYWFELRFNGEQIRRSTKSASHRIAGQIASAFHTALVKGEVGIVERRDAPPFDQAMKAFLAWSAQEHHDHPNTAKRSVTSSKPLLRRFRKVALDRISPEDVEQYKEARSAEKGKRTGRRLRPATVNRELACLREMFNHAAKGYPDLRNPVSRIKLLKEDNDQDRVLTYAEQRKYLAAAAATSPVLSDVAGIILETGMRPGEVYVLRSSEVDLDGGFLRVAKGKTPSAKRRVELTPECRRILEARIETVGAGYLFPLEGDPSRPIPKVANAHDRAVKLSGVAKFKLYALRHTWATRAAETPGVDLVTLAAMMGHSRIQMVMRYAHPTQANQASAMDKVAEHMATQERREQMKGEQMELLRSGSRLRVVPRTA